MTLLILGKTNFYGGYHKWANFKIYGGPVMIKKILDISFKKDGQHCPLYLQLESEIVQLICRGVLKSGQALPSSRELAQSMQLNRKTVVATYEELVAQGWVETRERSGVYVSSQLSIL